MGAKSDKRLVELAQRGDTHAIEILYDRYATAILRYCRSLLRSTQEAEDVQQEVFVTALSALRNGAGPDSFRPWLYRVAHNACISHMRAKRPSLVAVDGELVASATTEPASEEREELRQLLDDLSGLPEVQRGALLLREMDGFSYEQVGEVLGLPVTTVRSTIFRARSTLQGLAEARDAKCDEIQAELSELADRRGRRSRRITSHLHVCADCRDFRAGLRCRPTILRGYVPALPIGVLASVKATVLGAHGAGGATAGAAVAGGTSGFGILGGAGAGKLVAAAASACALVGGAGTQVGIIGSGGDGGARDTATVVVADAGTAGPGHAKASGARGPGRYVAAATTHSHVLPGTTQYGVSHHAPGTVVWRPADADGTVTRDDSANHAGQGAGAHGLVASASGPRHPGSTTNVHWGHATQGVQGQRAGSGLRDDDDDDADDDRWSVESRDDDGPRTQSAGSAERTSSATRTGSTSQSVAGPSSGDRSTETSRDSSRETSTTDGRSTEGATTGGDRPASEPVREPDPQPEQKSSVDQTPAQTPASEPASGSAPADPAPASPPPTDPAPDSPPADPATSPAPTSPTTSTSTTSDPAPPQDPAAPAP